MISRRVSIEVETHVLTKNQKLFMSFLLSFIIYDKTMVFCLLHINGDGVSLHRVLDEARFVKFYLKISHILDCSYLEYVHI